MVFGPPDIYARRRVTSAATNVVSCLTSCITIASFSFHPTAIDIIITSSQRHRAMSVLNISLKPHLIEILTPLPTLLPPELASQLIPYLSEPVPPTVPYPLLQSISQWTRTPEGLVALQSVSLEPQSYSMIALLAGSVTSPERKFPAYTPDKSPEEAEALKKAERQAITSLLNALLSIIGSGFAAWWAAGMTGWKNEWVCNIFNPGFRSVKRLRSKFYSPCSSRL